MEETDDDKVIRVRFKSDQTVEINSSKGKMLRPMDSDAVRERHDKLKKKKESQRVATCAFFDDDEDDWPPLA